MRLMVKESKRLPEIRTLAGSLTQDLPNRARYEEIQRCFDYVREHVRYTADINGLETLQTPQHTLQCGYGDCDDMATLLASLLESIGHRTMFCALAFSRAPDGSFMYSHVLTKTPCGYRRDGKPHLLPLDPTMEFDMGWQPPDIIHEYTIWNG